MSNYTLSDFLGIFLFYMPVMIFLTLVLQRGIFSMIEYFFTDEGPDKKNFFHHHFHYKAK
jgi:hypothetical protein